MIKFFKNIILFLLLSVIVGEVVVRLTHAVSDVPQRTIDEHGIQKYLPNQQGYWRGGEHKWMVNTLGWPGELPESYDNLIMIIGDSYIENFMNPNECHQSVFLKENMPAFNFMEAGRSGVSFIEALEISKDLDSLKPIQTLIYVTDEDFYESISEVKPMRDVTQLNLEKNTIQFGEMKAPMVKKALYTFKLAYYFYNRFPITGFENKESEPKNPIKISKTEKSEFQTEISQLITFVKQNYTITNKTLIFHPNSNYSIIETCKNAGFNIILLDSSHDATWTFDYDNHWTCYGHKSVAKQISKSLFNRVSENATR